MTKITIDLPTDKNIDLNKEYEDYFKNIQYLDIDLYLGLGISNTYTYKFLKYYDYKIDILVDDLYHILIYNITYSRYKHVAKYNENDFCFCYSDINIKQRATITKSKLKNIVKLNLI